MKWLMFLIMLGFVALSLVTHGARSIPPPAPAPVFKTLREIDAPPPRAILVSSDERETVDGLPVPIVPGTRVTEAEVRPPVRSKSPSSRAVKPGRSDSLTALRAAVHEERMKAPAGVRVVAGRLSATEERAIADAHLMLGREVADWLVSDVPTSWKPPDRLIQAMIVRTTTRPVVKDYGTLYETTLQVNFSGARRGEILAVYQRELVARRLVVLGGGLGFVLACLAAVSGYIRADEATKGYYTNWLRLASAAGVGGAGVLIYQMLA